MPGHIPFLATPARRPRARVLLACLAAALLLHWSLLGGADAAVGGSDGSDASVAAILPISVRSLDSPPPVPSTPAPALAAPQSQAPPAERSQQHVSPRPRVVAMAVAVAAVGASGPKPTTDAPITATADPASAVSGPVTASADTSVPVYRTVMPPAMTLHYQLRSGMLSGAGDLSWTPSGERYELRLDGRVGPLLVLTETSTGDIDGHGLAPLRYTDQRLRRSPQAANFQRDKGKITFSGPQIEFPLAPGAQDRLSWMIQIAAVVNADPKLAAEGSRIVFFVTGARGDADVWEFRCAGTEDLRGDDGAWRAVRFTREPRRPYDRLVEVWLLPERHYLPVRARLSGDSANDVFELLLRDMQPR